MDEVYPHNPLVAPSHLVPLGTQPIPKEVPICQGGNPPLRPTLKLSHAPETHCVASGLGFSARVNEVLLNSRKPSTRRSYQSK